MSELTRPQTPKKPRTVEVKTALPWTIIAIIVVATAAFIFGWMERSNQMITRSEVTAEVMQQLSAADAPKKASK